MTNEGYSRTQIWLHWGIAAMLVVAFLSHEAMKEAWRAVLRNGEVSFGYQIHVVAGLAVLALVIVRLVLRLRRGAPPAPQGNRIMARASVVVHWSLYFILVVLPVVGASAWFFGIRAAGEVHEALFSAGLALVLLHSLAALFHHYVLRDGLIWRMIQSR
jgi:cytochrome b561